MKSSYWVRTGRGVEVIASVSAEEEVERVVDDEALLAQGAHRPSQQRERKDAEVRGIGEDGHLVEDEVRIQARLQRHARSQLPQGNDDPRVERMEVVGLDVEPERRRPAHV